MGNKLIFKAQQINLPEGSNQYDVNNYPGGGLYLVSVGDMWGELILLVDGTPYSLFTFTGQDQLNKVLSSSNGIQVSEDKDHCVREEFALNLVKTVLESK